MTMKRVLKFPRDDNASTYVLIQTTSTGPKPLDLNLVGTEGDAGYMTTLRHDKTAALMVKNCSVSESEWQKLLEAVLSQKPLEDIQATASVQQSSISITIRKQVQGITQRLGSITLKEDDPDRIELFHWCANSVDALTVSYEAAAKSSAHVQRLEATVEGLRAQLDELVAAKEADETILLQKFRDLLNEKKVKIREQQKIIASVPPSSGNEPSTSTPAQASTKKTTRQLTQSRPTKRKAPATGGESVDMDVDIKSEPEDSELDNNTEATASGASDDEDNDDENDDDDANQASKPPSRSKKIEALPSQGQSEAQKAVQKKVERPPAPRSLPFANRKPPTAAPATTSTGVGSETESDDEL